MKTKVKEALLKAWNWFDGKKTTIGAVFSTGLIAAKFLKPSLFPDSTYQDLQILIGFWFSFSLGHKAWKQTQPTKESK